MDTDRTELELSIIDIIGNVIGNIIYDDLKNTDKKLVDIEKKLDKILEILQK